MGGDERLRLFCALRLPDDVLDGLVDWQRSLPSGGRIVPREHLHITTAFLGARPAADVPRVVSALESAGTDGPIRFCIRQYRETRSVGMLVLDDVDGHGTRYAEQLQERLEVLGLYRREQRPWLPHVTVSRFSQRAPRGRHPGARSLLPELCEFGPSDAAAFLSRLSPSGAQYEVLESVALGG